MTSETRRPPVGMSHDDLLSQELERFEREHPRSRELAREAEESLLAGVPMPWMIRWAGGFPVFAADAQGARFRDVDGHEYVDFCLGDTAAMTGHSPAPTVRAVTEQVGRGITLMLPSEDALWVGRELTRRFGLARWQFALTATDANRFAIRLARQLTGRPKILAFNWCYHGSVDETVAALEGAQVVARDGNVGPPVPLAETTRVVEWNDVEALERELDRKSTRLNSSHLVISYAVFCLKKKKQHKAYRPPLADRLVIFGPYLALPRGPDLAHLGLCDSDLINTPRLR